MSFEDYVQYRDGADSRRKSGEFADAGTHYTLASYEAFGKSGYRGTADISRGTYCLMSASLCYKLAGQDDRYQNRCRQGILIAEDLRDYVFEDGML